MVKMLGDNEMNEEQIAELAQKLYTEDGGQGSIYRKAPPSILREYENRAIAILEAVNDEMILTKEMK